MKRKMLAFLVFSLLLSIQWVSAQTPTAELPLQVVDTVPAGASELQLTDSYTLLFNQPVDCVSIESNIDITPATEGIWSCDEEGTSVHFTPSDAWAVDTNYTLVIGEGLTAVAGGAAEPFTTDFTTIGELVVAETLPAGDATNVAYNDSITIIFNRPVVPLTNAEQMREFPSPLQITPELEGAGEWLNTSIYIFTPTGLGYAPDTDYTVTVAQGLQAQDGATLNEDFILSFHTSSPRAVTLIPANASREVVLDQELQVRFNQPVDQALIEAEFALVNATAESEVSGTFEWAEDGLGFLFVPDERLTLGTLYEASIERLLESSSGDDSVHWSFETVPYPAVTGSYPPDGAVDADPYGGISIFFSGPINLDTLEGKFTVEPEPWREYDSYYGSYDWSYTLSYPTEPGTDYTITIAPGIEDIYGNVIEEETVIRYSTRNYDPSFNLQAPSSTGFYNANNDVTQLFVTQTNIDELRWDLYSIPVENFVELTFSAASDRITRESSLFEGRLLNSNTLDTSTASANANWYALITLNDAPQTCGELPSRLQVGDTAIVVSDPDPVRARETAPNGEILELLYRDYQVVLTNGPFCENGIPFWQITLADGRTAYVAESVEGEYLLDVTARPEAEVIELSQEDGSGLSAGIYLLDLYGDGVPAYNDHTMIVGNANLLMKSSTDAVLIWATDVQTGLPIANQEVMLYTLSSTDTPFTATTDAQGLALFPSSGTPFRYNNLAIMMTDDYFGVTDHEWSGGVESWTFGVSSYLEENRYEIYTYTDRPIYRPDQPVYFRGIVRLEDDVRYALPEVDEAPITIYSPTDEVVYQATLPLSEFGSFSGQFDLDAEAALGYYRLVVGLSTDTDASLENWWQYDSITFGVAEYRAPEFQVEVTTVEPEYINGENILANIDARYFFGGAVAEGNVEYSVTSQPYGFAIRDAYYSFNDVNVDGGPSAFYAPQGGMVLSGTDILDAQGQVTLEIPANLEDTSASQIFMIEVTVTDESNQPVSARTSVIVHKGDVYVGVRMDEYVGVAGEASSASLIVVDVDGNPVPDYTIDIEVIERRWNSVQEQDELGRTTWDYQVEEIVVETQRLVTDENGQATLTFIPPNGGIFKVFASVMDSAGRVIVASANQWVSSSDYVAWRQQNSNRIDLVINAEEYSVGDTAEILIASPFQGEVQALITVERGAVYETEVITMTNNSYIYELPITEDMIPNVYVSVFIVKGVDETNPVAAFRMGMIAVNVETSSKVLHFDVSTNVEDAQPGETVTYTVHVTDANGDPVRAELGASLTDLSVLTIAPANVGNILSSFYFERGNYVMTAAALTINTDQLTQTILDTIKGGGGGFGEGGIFDIREEFIDTPYWQGSIITDENGVATFDVTLPDNLTTWRLDLRAVTDSADQDLLVGQTTSDIISTLPLLIRPVTPRFFVVGDSVDLGAVVNNNTDEDLVVDVTLSALGVDVVSDITQQVTILAGSRARVNWEVRVTNSENADLTFLVSSEDGNYSDASKPPLGQGDDRLIPIVHYAVPETVGTSGMLSPSESAVTEGILLSEDIDPTQGTLDVTIDRSLAGVTLESLDFLRRYEGQSIEAVISRFLPNIITLRALQSLNVDDPLLEANLDELVNYALQRLYASQNTNGGWSWYRGTSHPMTTAYALIGLYEAQQAGYPVEQRVIDLAISYLESNHVRPSSSSPTWHLNRHAFILYALARVGAPDASRMNVLFEYRSRLDTFSQAALALAFASLPENAGAESAEALVTTLISDAELSANGAFWSDTTRDYYNWNTDTRSTAMALSALVAVRPNSELIPNVVRYLVMARTADAWETMQETAWVVMALTDFMRTSGELEPDYTFTVSVNDALYGEDVATTDNVLESTQIEIAIPDLVLDEANRLVITREGDEGNLYYTAYLNSYVHVPEIEALDQGIILQRQYVLEGDETNTPITEARIGDVVEVQITIIAPRPIHYLVLQDPIPAGSDAIDPSLLTSQQVGTEAEVTSEDQINRPWWMWGWYRPNEVEYRDDSVMLYTEYLAAGTYQFSYSIRIGLSGEYNVIPTTAQAQYFPEIYGRTAGTLFTILPEAE